MTKKTNKPKMTTGVEAPANITKRAEKRATRSKVIKTKLVEKIEPKLIVEPEPAVQEQPMETAEKKVYQKIVQVTNEALPKVEKKLNKYGVEYHKSMGSANSTTVIINVDNSASANLKAKVADIFFYLDSTEIIKNGRAKTITL